jgi:hypothetical protein
MSQNLNLPKPKFQSQLRSRPVREALEQIESNFNLLRAEVYASLATTAGEVVSARDNLASLVDNMNIRSVYGNNLGTAAYVDELGTPAMHVHVDAGAGIVNGVGVSWASATSATLSAPAAGKHRLDIVVINTDNSLSVIGGGATASANNCALPSIASTQEQLAFLYLTAGTTSLNDNVQIFNVKPYSKDIADVFISSPSTASIGDYDANNIVICSSLYVSQNQTIPNSLFRKSSIYLRAKGNIYINGTVSLTPELNYTANFKSNSHDGETPAGYGAGGAGGASGYLDWIIASHANSIGGDGLVGKRAAASSRTEGGAGGGGGGSFLSAGGDGGTGGVIGAPDSLLNDGAYGIRRDGTTSLILVASGYIKISGNIIADGDNGGNGGNGAGSSQRAGGGGAGGASAGNVYIVSRNGVYISGAVYLSGGNGGNGGDAIGGTYNASGGGGGGGAGGLFYCRSKVVSITGSVVYDGGSPGNKGTASGGSGNSDGADGELGGGGVYDSEIVDPNDAVIDAKAAFFPCNIGLSFLE